MGILYRAVYMAFSGEIHHEIDVIIGKESVGKGTVTDVALYEEAPFIVYIVLDGAEVAGVSQSI